MYYWINYARFAICTLSLTISSAYDIKTREVPNEVWVLSMPASAALTILSLFLSGWSREIILSLIIALAVTSILSMVLFYLGLFGGADAKALIYLAVAMPERPSFPFIDMKLGFFTPQLIIPLPISTFNNSALFAALLTIFIALRNLIDLVRNKEIFSGLEHERLAVKIGAFFTGYRVDVEKLRSGRHHYFLLEEFNECEDGRIERKLRLFKFLSEDEDESKIKIPERIQGKIWVTPGLPFIAFITIGFITAIFIGDLILMLVNLMLAP